MFKILLNSWMKKVVRCLLPIQRRKQKETRTDLYRGQEYWNKCAMEGKVVPSTLKGREANWNKKPPLVRICVFLPCYHWTTLHRGVNSTQGTESWAIGNHSFPLKLKFCPRVFQLAFVFYNLPKVYLQMT